MEEGRKTGRGGLMDGLGGKCIKEGVKGS